MLWAIEALAPPAILIFRSIAASFASAIAQMIPAPLLNAQRQIAKPQAYEDATDLARERGLIDEAGRATEAGRAFLIKRNPEDSRYFDPVDAGLGKGTGRVIRRELRDDLLRERFTTDGLTRMYQDQSIEEGSAAGQAFLKAGRDLDALFQQNRQPAIPEMIRKPRDRSPAVIEAEAARDAIRASLMDPRQQLEAMGFLTPLFDMGPSRPGSPLQSASAAGDEANGESLGAIDYKTQSDRLAKMGGLLGGSAVQLRHDERTARATETMVQQGETANRHLAEISREGRRSQGATWQS
jgi:hypothetical protein